MSGLKERLLGLLSESGAASKFRVLLRDRACILMLHRFAHPDRGVAGHDLTLVRAVLERLRHERIDILALDELLGRLEAGASVHGAVAFTIDDGYADHAEAAAPAFAAFDAPVTTFVVSGFLDGRLWLWWDQVEFAFEHTSKADLALPLGGAVVSAKWSDPETRRAVQRDVIERLKHVPDPERVQAIAHIAALLDVELPAAPPTQYAPMSWDQLRRAEEGGMRFGPHTVTHPVLARTSDEQSAHEIGESWRRLQQEARAPQAVFCYPNGGLTDFGPRETAALDRLGFRGAVVGALGYARAGAFTTGDARFRVRRFPFADDLPHVWQYVAGVERAKQFLSRQGAA